MTKIEELLTPGEKVIKTQRRIQMGAGAVGMPAGDLYLTNSRLIFLHSKGWSLVTPVPGAALLGKNIITPLRDIKSVKKGLGSVKVQADKKYEFMVSAWKAGGWVDAIQQAISALKQPPTPVPPPKAQQPTTARAPPPPQPKARRFCRNCGSPVNLEDKFCESCGTKLQ